MTTRDHSQSPGPGQSPEPGGDPDASEARDAIEGLARVAAIAGWRSSGWALRTSLRGTQRILEAATSPPKAIELARDASRGARAILHEISELTSADGPMSAAAPAADAAKRMADVVSSPLRPSDANAHPPSEARTEADQLRVSGEQLLRKSRDVRHEFEAHPAYGRILSELAPDEARILRLLLLEGPQAAVDIRTGGPLGLLRSRLVAPGLSMIGARAGCRYVDGVPAYLNNLFRLGMVWFSRETLRDPLRYQVLEAQPEVLKAIHSVSQAKVVRRSIHLTPFGEDFCRMCLCPETGGPDTLPAHSIPDVGSNVSMPPD